MHVFIVRLGGHSGSESTPLAFELPNALVLSKSGSGFSL